MNNHNHPKKLTVQGRGRQFSTESRGIFQKLKEIEWLQEQIDSQLKELKKTLVVRHLVDNYDKITQTKQKRLEKDWELAKKDEKRKKGIAEWDRIQAEDEENLNS